MGAAAWHGMKQWLQRAVGFGGAVILAAHLDLIDSGSLISIFPHLLHMSYTAK